MPDSPLSIAISTSSNPLSGLGHFAGALDARSVAAVVLALMFAFWLIYTLVATYHLVRYGHRSWLTVPAIGIHLFVSLTIALFAVSGLA